MRKSGTAGTGAVTQPCGPQRNIYINNRLQASRDLRGLVSPAKCRAHQQNPARIARLVWRSARAATVAPVPCTVKARACAATRQLAIPLDGSSQLASQSAARREGSDEMR